MDKMKASGLIVGIIGLAVLFIFLIDSLIMLYTEYGEYSELWMTVYSSSAVLWSVAFTLAATALVLHVDKKGAYLMALSTIIGTIGFVPVFFALGTANLAGSILLTLVTILPLLVSTVLFAMSSKQQP